MKTWNDYKEHVRTVDPEIGKDIDEVENISSIVSAMVEQRTSLGLSQRELAAMLLSFKLDAPAPCRLDAPDLDLICYASADCLHQHLQVI